MEGTIIFIVQQLAYQSPTLVVYGGGVLLGVMWYRRCPKPAMCCLLGCGVMLLAALVMAGVQATLMQSRGSDHGSITSLCLDDVDGFLVGQRSARWRTVPGHRWRLYGSQ